MFCENCGSKLEDGSLFCTNCGAKQEVVENVSQVTTGFTPEQTATAAAPVAAAPKEPFGAKIKKVPFYVWIIVAVVLVAAIVGGVFIYKAKHTININDYVTVEFDGYDTMGTATVELDEEFWEDLFEKSSFKDKAKVEKKEISSYYSEADYMQDELSGKVKYEVDPENKLSNGDEVTVSWKVKASSIKKKFGVTIKCDDKKFTVEDLEEVETFDPFESLEVTFTGVDGDGQVSFNVTSDEEVFDDFSFDSDDRYYLSEGDVITVEFAPYLDEDDLAEYCASEYGMVPTVKEKEYTVEGLGHYVSDVSELTETSLANVLTDAKDEVIKEANLSDKETMNACNYKGAYLLISDDPTDGNEVFLVYECVVDLADGEGNTDQITYCTYVEASNVTINADGVCGYAGMYRGTYHTFDYKSSFDSNFYYYGYETLDECNAAIADDYKYYIKYYDYTLTNTFGSSTEEATTEEAE